MSVRDAARELREKGSHSYTSNGVVRSVREDYSDPDKVHVEVRGPKAKRKSTKGAVAEPYSPSQDICCPKSLGLTVGDKVSIVTTLTRDVD